MKHYLLRAQFNKTFLLWIPHLSIRFICALPLSHTLSLSLTHARSLSLSPHVFLCLSFTHALSLPLPPSLSPSLSTGDSAETHKGVFSAAPLCNPTPRLSVCVRQGSKPPPVKYSHRSCKLTHSSQVRLPAGLWGRYPSLAFTAL